MIYYRKFVTDKIDFQEKKNILRKLTDTLIGLFFKTDI